MAQSHDTGKRGEELAVGYLVKQSCRILETNWQSNHQEVDIIASKGGLLLIVEVKTRNSDYYGMPEVSVTRQKQRMLIKAANHYIAMNELDTEVRFDIISILFKGKEYQLRHIKDAFFAY